MNTTYELLADLVGDVLAKRWHRTNAEAQAKAQPKRKNASRKRKGKPGR